MELSVPVIVMFIVFALIAVRQVGRFRLKIWQVMLGGAVAVLATMQISIPDALAAIDLDVMLFLLGMFIVGEALHRSGYLFHMAHSIFDRAGSVDRLILLMLFSVGLLSAFLMNDTLAIIGTPLVLHYASRYKISPKLMLLSLAFAVTIGSAMSPIGNPQNLLIAVSGGVPDPFVSFFSLLLLPTLVNLLLAYLVLKLFFRKEFAPRELEHHEEPIGDPRLARLCKASLAIIAVAIAAKISVAYIAPQYDFPLTLIAVAAALPIVVFSPQRADIVRKVDWPTLVFFASMFVLMAAVWSTGFFQGLVGGVEGITSVPVILGMSVGISQLVSNVPYVALIMPLLMQAGAGPNEMLALAAGSTIAGNLFILGAASNVIIIQNAEKEGCTLTFLEFAKVGGPLTALNCLVYWFFLSVL